jgi:hypothetical protein
MPEKTVVVKRIYFASQAFDFGESSIAMCTASDYLRVCIVAVRYMRPACICEESPTCC